MLKNCLPAALRAQLSAQRVWMADWQRSTSNTELNCNRDPAEQGSADARTAAAASDANALCRRRRRRSQPSPPPSPSPPFAAAANVVGAARRRRRRFYIHHKLPDRPTHVAALPVVVAGVVVVTCMILHTRPIQLLTGNRATVSPGTCFTVSRELCKKIPTHRWDLTTFPGGA